MNPPPLDRQIAGWGWWADPGFAVWMMFGAYYNLTDVPTEAREAAADLCRRNYHPRDAVWMVMEGMDQAARRTEPRQWIACRTWDDWLARFPNAQLGSYRRGR